MAETQKSSLKKRGVIWGAGIFAVLLIGGLIFALTSSSPVQNNESSGLKVLGAYRNADPRMFTQDNPRESLPQLSFEDQIELTLGALAGHHEKGLEAFSNLDYTRAIKSFQIVIKLIEEKAGLFEISQKDIQKYLPLVQSWITGSQGPLTPKKVEAIRDKIESMSLQPKTNPHYQAVMRQYLDALLMLTIADSQAKTIATHTEATP